MLILVYAISLKFYFVYSVYSSKYLFMSLVIFPQSHLILLVVRGQSPSPLTLAVVITQKR